MRKASEIFFVNESSVDIKDNIYSYSKSNLNDIVYLRNWMDKRGIYFSDDVDNKKIRILIDPKLEQEEMLKLRELMDDFDIYKLWEEVAAVSTSATLGNTHGMGSVSPPTNSSIGSGDVLNPISHKKDGEDDDKDENKKIIDAIISDLKIKLKL